MAHSVTQSSFENTCEGQVVVTGDLGLHARPAAKIIRTASEFASTIILVNENKSADARSILEVLSLSAGKGTKLLVRCSGPDAEEALKTMIDLFAGSELE